jgi:hypothetical protein
LAGEDFQKGPAMRTHLFTAITLGLLVAACQPSNQGLSTAPQSPPPAYAANYPSAAYAAGGASSGQVCADYGFSPGTAAFENCVSRERAARSAGRVNRDYAEARLADDARNACASYGLQANSRGYNHASAERSMPAAIRARARPRPPIAPTSTATASIRRAIASMPMATGCRARAERRRDGG